MYEIFMFQALLGFAEKQSFYKVNRANGRIFFCLSVPGNFGAQLREVGEPTQRSHPWKGSPGSKLNLCLMGVNLGKPGYPGARDGCNPGVPYSPFKCIPLLFQCPSPLSWAKASLWSSLTLFIMSELIINSKLATAGPGHFELHKYSQKRRSYEKIAVSPRI